jgi:CelD/BcsL family acetyltransferase involved in cellulose biosynthesis
VNLPPAAASRPRGRNSPRCGLEGDIEALAPEWDELVERVGAPPFFRPGWIDAWWKAFGKGELEILTTRRGGRLAGLLALERRRGELRSTSNWHTPWFGPLSEDAEVSRELAESTVSRTRRRLALAFLDGESPDVAAFREAATAAGYRVLLRTLERSPYLDIDGDWTAFAAGLRKGFLADLARRFRRLREQGDVSFEIADGRERLKELLAEGFQVEASGWKGETAILSRPETHLFYSDLARWAARRGSLRLVFLRLDRRPIAFGFTLQDRGSLYSLKGGYDPAFGRFSPGQLILRGLLEHAFATGLTRFEFLGGAEPYKLVWTPACRDLRLLQLFSPGAFGLLDWAAYAHGRPLAKRAHLDPIVRRLRR